MLGIAVFVILAALTVSLGGIMPGLLPACALAAGLGMVAAAAPTAAPVRRLWWLGCAFLVWVLFTTLPLPGAMAWLAGPRRGDQFASVQRTLGAVSEAARRPPGNTAAPANPPAREAEAATDVGRILANVPSTPPAPGTEVESVAPMFLAGQEPLPTTTSEAPRLTVATRLSLNAAGTRRFFLLAVSGMGLFWMCASLGAVGRRRLLKAMVVGGTVTAAFGILGAFHPGVAQSTPWQMLFDYGVRQAIWPFVNRNHFASFAAMLAPAALCLTVYPDLGWSHAARQGADGRGDDDTPGAAGFRGLGWSHQTRAGTPLAFLERIVFLLCFGILVSAVFLSLSRGGTLALVAGIIVTVLYWLRGQQAGASTAATALGICVLLGLLFLPSEDVRSRLDTIRDGQADKSGSTRIQNWHDALGLWRDYPLAGGGMESFRTLFQLYQTHGTCSAPRYAENEYVQLLADGGLVAAGAAILFVVLYGRAFATPRVRLADAARDLSVRPLKAAVLGCVVVMAVHALCDFPCRMPLNACVAASLLGLGMPWPERPRRPLWRSPAPALALGGLLAATVWVADSAGDRTHQADGDTFLQAASSDEIGKALRAAPTYWFAWYEMGRRLYAGDVTRDHQETANAAGASWRSRGADRSWFRLAWNGLAAGGVKRDAAAAAQEDAAGPGPGTGTRLPLQFAPTAAPVETRVSDGAETDAAAPPQPPLPSPEFLRLSLTCFRRATDCNPSDYRPWWTLARVELAAGNVDRARIAFRHVVLLAPHMGPDVERQLNQIRTTPKPSPAAP